jgi:hypothetical protein
LRAQAHCQTSGTSVLKLRASVIARRRTEPGWRVRQSQRAERAINTGEPFFPLRATTTAADSRCSRRRSAGGDGGTTLFRLSAPTKTAATQRTSLRAERAIQQSAMREQLQICGLWSRS